MHFDLAGSANNRHVRRLMLAERMVRHDAKAGTTQSWTGYTADQLLTLCRKWGVDLAKTRRGRTPTSLADFFTSRKRISETTYFACLCQALGALPERRGSTAAEHLPGIENGERLCDALEAFRALRPHAWMHIDYAILLVTSLIRGDLIALGVCSCCGGARLIYQLAERSERCEHCSRAASTSKQLSASQESGNGEKDDDEDSNGE